MFLSPNIVQCTDCLSLKEMVERIDCSLYQLIKNKWNNETFNVSQYFCSDRFKDLERYRRIINERIYNPCYPKKEIEAQDIVSKAGRLLYGDGNCSKCVSCAEFSTTTTTTTSTTTTSTSTSTTTTTTTTTTTSTTTTTTTTVIP